MDAFRRGQDAQEEDLLLAHPLVQQDPEDSAGRVARAQYGVQQQHVPAALINRKGSGQSVYALKALTLPAWINSNRKHSIGAMKEVCTLRALSRPPMDARAKQVMDQSPVGNVMRQLLVEKLGRCVAAFTPAHIIKQ